MRRSVAAALDGYAAALTGAVRGEREGHLVPTGHDPALGQLALVGN
jgi:hypothetical protein